MSTQSEKLREEIRHALQSCMYTPKGQPCQHIATGTEDEADVEAVISLITAHTLRARRNELARTVFMPLNGKTWLDVRPDVELARIKQRLDELDTEIKKLGA